MAAHGETPTRDQRLRMAMSELDEALTAIRAGKPDIAADFIEAAQRHVRHAIEGED